jgi:class 3 adenylate cyclase
MILSCVVLAITLTVNSLKNIQADKGFTRMILEENKIFLVSSLRFGHGMMARMGTEKYEDLIELALKSKFIRYLAIVDKEGKLIAQSDPIRELPSLKKYDPRRFKDGGIVSETERLLLVSYKAEEIVHKESPMGRSAHMMAPRGQLHESGWFLVALDISDFKSHYRHTVIQTATVGAALLLFGILIIIFLGVVQRYEIAHISIERLNKIKRVLANFVPATAKNIIEKDPEKALLDKYIQDATVLFLDIEGFTILVQKYPQERMNRAIESYFSCFLNLMQKNEGDVNETAGDGMMVIFVNPDPAVHARNAVQAALGIHEHCMKMSQSGDSEIFPIQVNIGISSGEVYLGSTKMRGAEGDRWTFTASGAVTILAARLADYAREGQILITEETAHRIGRFFSLTNLGKVSLKNLENSGKVYQLPVDGVKK